MSQGHQFGRYMLTHLLGKGGMAEVYRAIRSGPMGFAKEVAIKRLYQELTQDEQQLKSLINEARIGGQLRHPNIVEIYEFDKVGDQYYLAMEYVSGWTVEKFVHTCATRGIQIPVRVALDIVQQVCEGLDYAHFLDNFDGEPLNLVHRDMKPGNLIINRKGVIKIMDFGIAKSKANLFRTTAADVTKGTPQYMSPEQVAGAKDLDRTSDVFSLGTILHELIVGTPVFTGDNLPAVLYAVVQANISQAVGRLERMHPGLGGVFARACAKRPRDRYPSAGDFGEDLRNIMEGLGREPTTAAFFRALRGDEGGQSTYGDGEGLPAFLTMDSTEAAPRPSALTTSPGTGSLDGFDYDDVQDAKPTDDDYLNDTGAFANAYKKNQNQLHWVATIGALVIAGVAIAFALSQKPYQVETDTEDLPTPVLRPTGEEPAPKEALDSAPEGEVEEAPKLGSVQKESPKRKIPSKKRRPKTKASTQDGKKTKVNVPKKDPQPGAVIAKGGTSVTVPSWGNAANADAQKKGNLSVRASTPRARVLVDGRDIGRYVVPSYPLPVGKHTIILRSQELGNEISREVVIDQGKTVVVPGYDFYKGRWK